MTCEECDAAYRAHTAGTWAMTTDTLNGLLAGNNKSIHDPQHQSNEEEMSINMYVISNNMAFEQV